MIKLTVEADNHEGQDKIKRMLDADSAYSLLWEINQIIKQQLKHGAKKDEEVLEEIQTLISEEDIFKHWQ